MCLFADNAFIIDLHDGSQYHQADTDEVVFTKLILSSFRCFLVCHENLVRVRPLSHRMWVVYHDFVSLFPGKSQTFG